MSFHIVDEMDRLEFHDVSIESWEKSEDGYVLTLGGVVVKHNCSVNETYTDRYASVLTLKLLDASIEECLLEGYKYYDANNELKIEQPDTVVPVVEYDSIIKKFTNALLFELAAKEKKEDRYRYLLIIDTDEETTYCVTINCASTSATWEHMMNKVQA